MPVKILFSQMFHWLLSLEMKGSCACPVDAGKWEKLPWQVGQTAGRWFSVPYPEGNGAHESCAEPLRNHIPQRLFRKNGLKA